MVKLCFSPTQSPIKPNLYANKSDCYEDNRTPSDCFFWRFFPLGLGSKLPSLMLRGEWILQSHYQTRVRGITK